MNETAWTGVRSRDDVRGSVIGQLPPRPGAFALSRGGKGGRLVIEVVLRDADDTLFDFSGSDRRALERHFRMDGLPCAEKTFGRWHRATRSALERLAAGRTTYAEYRRNRARLSSEGR